MRGRFEEWVLVPYNLGARRWLLGDVLQGDASAEAEIIDAYNARPS